VGGGGIEGGGGGGSGNATLVDVHRYIHISFRRSIILSYDSWT